MKLQNVFKFIFLCLLLVFFKIGCSSPAFTSGKLYIHREEYQNAIKNFEKEISQNPANASAFYYLGYCYAKVKRFEDMNKTFLSCQKLSKLYDDQIAEVRAVFWFDPFNSGIQKLQDDQVHEAIKDLKLAVLIDSTAVDALTNLAAAQIKIEDYGAAIKNYTRATKIDQYNPQLLITLGLLYSEMKNFSKAIEIFNQLHKIDPLNKQGIINLSYSYAVIGDREKAINIFDNAIQKNYRDPDIYFNLGKLHFLENNYDLAVLNFNKVLEFEPEDFETMVLLGNSYFNMGEKIRETRIKFTKSSGDKNKTDQLKKSELNLFYQAKTHYEKAKTINPNNIDLLQNLSKIFIRLKMPNKAKAAFEKAEALKIKNNP